MIMYVGSDHRGFALKESLKVFLEESGYTVEDMGNDHYDETDDYPDFAKRVAEKVSADPYDSKGILVCGSGVGMDMVANRYSLVRSVLAMSADQAMASRHDDDTNVLTIAGDYLDIETVKKIVSVWTQTPFSEAPEDKRRIQKTQEIGSSHSIS